MRNENFYIVQGWMVNELKLTGNKLLIYAIIYGFSQDQESSFSGSIKYLQGCTGASRRTILGNLKQLVDEGHLTKQYTYIHGQTFASYQANTNQIAHPVQKLHHPRAKTAPPPGAKIAPNNILLDNIEDNIDIDFSIFDSNNSQENQIKEAWGEWNAHRKRLKKEFATTKSEQRALEKLAKLANKDPDKATKIIQQSIDENWRGLFPLNKIEPDKNTKTIIRSNKKTEDRKNEW